MSKISITKEFSWDMAHMLSDHRGLCKNLHGHTYKMEVKISRLDRGVLESTLHSDGMVIDFSDLKSIVKSKIVDLLDHAFMYWNNSNDPVEHQIAELLKNNGKKVFEVNYRPTAENMANDFLAILNKEFDGSNIIIERIKVWETPTSFAEAEREK